MAKPTNSKQQNATGQHLLRFVLEGLDSKLIPIERLNKIPTVGTTINERVLQYYI